VAQCCTQAGAGWVGWMLVWVIAVAGVVWLVGRLFPGPQRSGPRARLDARSAARESDVEIDHQVRAETGGQPAPDNPSPIR
jgi:hypothetical protein